MKVLEALASLKLAVVLLVLLLLALSAGTIIESQQNATVAQQLVYFSWWFIALQGVFALNVIASIIHLAPWGRQRLGYLLTHGGLILTLAGAVATWLFAQGGQLGLWEGQRGDEVVEAGRASKSEANARLPFQVQLDDFHIDYYQGTHRPANFTSEVTIIYPDGRTEPARIFMNHPLTREGWTLFQSSYQQDRGREATILSVSKDPGQNLAFFGYGVLVLGMCVVLGTRISQKRALVKWEQEQAAAKAGGGTKAAAAVALALLAVAAPARADDTIDALRRLPVQHDGRVMPFDTAAREAVVKITGKRSWNGADPAATVAGWALGGAAAMSEPVIAIDAELAEAVGLPGTTYASFQQLVSNPSVRKYVGEASQLSDAQRARTGLHALAEKLEERLVWMNRVVVERDVLLAVPDAANPAAKWRYPQPLATVEDLAKLAAGPRLPGWTPASVIDLEVRYNQLRPARIAWLVLAAALVASILAWNGRRRLLDAAAVAGLVLGFAAMSWGIYARWIAGDRIPASNMYESLLFLAWGVGFFAVVAMIFMRNRLVVMNANAMAALTMGLVDLLPMDGFIHPVPPVLAGTPWLAIHVPIIMVSYAVLALGVVVAHLQIGYEIFAPRRREMVTRTNDLLYWYMHVGSILLIVGILTGSIWAADSWGRYWGWDPKEVWSLVAFLAYMAILHGRWDKLIGPFGVAALSIVAFQTILMTYLGVNYVLGTGLHAYGFGDSPVVKWMVIVAVAEAAFLAWGVMAHRRNRDEAAPGLAAT